MFCHAEGVDVRRFERLHGVPGTEVPPNGLAQSSLGCCLSGRWKIWPGQEGLEAWERAKADHKVDIYVR